MRNLFIITVLSFVVFSTSGYALTIDNVAGSWSNVQGRPEYQRYVDSYTRFQTGTVAYGNQSETQVQWGLSTTPGGAKSGLGFTGTASDTTFDFEDVFEIGQLRHFNYEIYTLTAASSVDLALNFAIDEIPVALSFDLTFQINETPNVDEQGNKFPVDDIIGFSDATAIQTFTYDNMIYTFELLGFGNSPEDMVTQFISQEFNDSATRLFGRLTSAPINPPEPPVTPAVPEPTTLLLVGIGLMGLAALRRRAK